MKPTTPAQPKRTLTSNKIPSSTRVTRATSKTKVTKEVGKISPTKKLIRHSPLLSSNSTDKEKIKIARSKNVEGDENIEKQPIKAFLRIRPTSSEDVIESKPYLVALSDRAVQMVDPSPSTSRLRQATAQSIYTFTKVFPPETHQSEFFVDVGLPLVRDLLNGENGLVFAYGVTNSGKTYTIQGGSSKGSAGLLPRTLDVIFNSLDGLHSEAHLRPVRLAGIEYDNDDNESARSSLTAVDLSSNTNESVLADVLVNHPGWNDHDETVVQVDKTYEYSAWISYFEIYNEKIFNLLDTSSLDSPEITSLQPRHYSMNGPFAGPSGGLGPSNSDSFLVKRKALTLKNDPDGGKYIANLREIRVRTAEEAKAIVKLGQANRKVFGTLANQVSSRSHSVFTIKIMKSKGAIPDINGVRVSRLSIVDLAGSERANNTQSSGERLKEAGSINKSLMVLGQCMEALRGNQRKLASASAPQNVKLNVVPFRHSKLTEIFQDFFVGNGKAMMIVNINPYDTGFDENSNVMKFSALAKDIHTVAQKRPPPSAIPRLTPQTTYRKVTLSIGGASGVKITERQFDIVEEEEDQDDEGDHDANDSLIEALLERIEELGIRLFESEMRCALVESVVREEVTREIEERMSRMENMYRNRMRSELEENQLKIDRKIDMLRQAGFVVPASEPENENFSDIDDEIVVERSLTVETNSDGSSQLSDEYASPLVNKGRPSHMIISEDSSGDIGLFGSPEEEEAFESMEEENDSFCSNLQTHGLTTVTEHNDSNLNSATPSSLLKTPTMANKTGYRDTPHPEDAGNLATVTKQRVSFDSLLYRDNDHSDEPVAIIPDKQRRKESIRYAGPDAEYVPREGEIDLVPKKKKRILGKKKILSEEEIEAFARNVNLADQSGGNIQRLTRSSKKLS